MLAIVTGTDNIYSIPGDFFGNDGKTWLHVAGHLFIGGTTLNSCILNSYYEPRKKGANV